MATWERVALGGNSLGIRIGGDDAGMIFSGFSDAFWSAERLATHGYQDVVIFDRQTGQTLQVVAEKSELQRRRA